MPVPEKEGRVRSSERLRSVSRGFQNSWQLYVLLIIPLAYLILFKYGPMYGAQIAFKDYRITQGIWESPWAGLKHFRRFVNSFDFWMLIRNTLALSFYELLAGFPVPIILALSLNYVGKSGFKKTVQMITYAPHFISTVVMVGIILQFLAPRFGLVNLVIQAFGGESINFMGRVRWWRSIFVWSGVWQRAGYGSIIYLAALSSIDPQLHEAAIVDGATKPQRIWHIDLPGIMPTAVILLILNIGRILNIGFEKVLLMQNSLNLPVSEIIDTYVYKIGLASPTVNFAYPTAIGLFRSVISLILLITVNRIAKHVTESSLW
jgi:multiple sugar transport system permease protein/putative aldouronate transport system permease protein